jgi:protocatechuate 3,4-dioxygenase beta subunit
MSHHRKTRRDALRALGSAGATLLVGCGGRSDSPPANNPGDGGLSGSGGLPGTGGVPGSGGGMAETGGAAGMGGAPQSPCIVRPQQIEGPYFVDELLNRVDIRSDPATGLVKEGVPLRLAIHVHQLRGNTCAPLPGALVDLWQCDALGAYAGFVDSAGRFDTRGQKFLRGYQLSDEAGAVQFLTIYPGWYAGRTVHLHFKVRTSPPTAGGFQFVSQLYFDQAVTNSVLLEPPYSMQGPSTVPNASDGIFRSGGENLMVSISRTNQGLLGRFDLALQLPA